MLAYLVVLQQLLLLWLDGVVVGVCCLHQMVVAVAFSWWLRFEAN